MTRETTDTVDVEAICVVVNKWVGVQLCNMLFIWQVDGRGRCIDARALCPMAIIYILFIVAGVRRWLDGSLVGVRSEACEGVCACFCLC